MAKLTDISWEDFESLPLESKRPYLENGAIPNVGEVFELPPYRFTIERKTAARIELIRVDVIDQDNKK